MKTLLLMRHAKSSWKDSGLADYDRPLNRRGRKTAAIMAQWIERQELLPDMIFCSTAVRARQTCELLLEEWKTPILPRYLATLYHCPAEQVAEILQRLPDSAERALLIGHNPGLADFLQSVAGYNEKFPTAALAELAIDVTRWRDVTLQTAMKLIHVWRPRELD